MCLVQCHHLSPGITKPQWPMCVSWEVLGLFLGDTLANTLSACRQDCMPSQAEPIRIHLAEPSLYRKGNSGILTKIVLLELGRAETSMQTISLC